MESNEPIKPKLQSPIIFGLMTSYQVHELLEKNGARNRETKAIFLIRSSSTAGLTTVSYYSQEEDNVKNLRLGLTDNGWKLAPKALKEPKITDNFEVKEKYTHDKAKFDLDMRNFLNTAKMLFEQEVTQEQIKSLAGELQKNEFKLEGLIKPSHDQASLEKHYTVYFSNAFVSDI